MGTAFRLTVRDESDVVFDLSAATVKTMLFRKPSLGVLERTATLATDGSDGVMQYVSASGDLDEAGSWRMQGYVETSGGWWHTDVHKFKVHENLR